MIEFKAELLSTGKTTTGFIVPPGIVERLGGGRKPKVVARLGDYTMRSSVAFMGGAFWLGISAAHREASGLGAGDRVTITLEQGEKGSRCSAWARNQSLQPRAPSPPEGEGMGVRGTLSLPRAPRAAVSPLHQSPAAGSAVL